MNIRLVVVSALLCIGQFSHALDPSGAPSDNFDLTAWKVTLPDQTEIKEQELSSGFESANEFYTDATTGAMVFVCPNDGATGGSTYPRSELREMLRAGNTSISTTGIGLNNWVFSTASQANQDASGGVDGTLSATVAVDHVSTSGDSSKIGRVIVGQIHASNDEPCRLYYRKLPGNSKGSIYIAHEPTTGSEQWYDMIGSRSNSASDPSDGIALGEQFSYEIDVIGNALTVTIMRPGKPNVVQPVDMSASGFANDWMYFKAGCYNQNNSGDAGEYAQVSFFALTHTHNVIGNDPPAFTGDPINEINADEGVAYSSTIADNASDPESDPMTFSKLSGPAWLSVAVNGALSGTPGTGDVGANVFTVQVIATGGSDTATLNITVDPDPNLSPSFSSDPIEETAARDGMAYSSTLADDASDPESDPLTFSKVSGPAWLSVASGGALSGRPGTGDTGLNSWTVSVSDGINTPVEAALNIRVANADGSIELINDGFESGWGNFSNVSGDDSHNWTRNFGYTDSSNTGPSKGANGSTWYAYLETSSGSANSNGDTAYLESSDINGSDRTLTFYYHMYGINIGTLNVDVYSGDTWNTAVWSLSGQQHTAYGEVYTMATVDLSAYTGTIKIRFRAVAAGGYQGDMAIDDIMVVDSSAVNDSPTGYDLWVDQYDIPGADKLGHNDSDGINNLTEYMFGGNPTNSSLTGYKPYLNGSMQYVYVLADDPLITYQVMMSTSLTTGFNMTNTAYLGSDTYGSGMLIHSNSVETTTGELFLRLNLDYTE